MVNVLNASITIISPYLVNQFKGVCPVDLPAKPVTISPPHVINVLLVIILLLMGAKDVKSIVMNAIITIPQHASAVRMATTLSQPLGYVKHA